jgi:hypothetical protein
MSITLSYEMFSMLSKSSRDEILAVFGTPSFKVVKEEPRSEINRNTAFESASLTFSKPLVLPVRQSEPLATSMVVEENEPEPVAEDIAPVQKNTVIRVAKSYPIAKATDLYSVAPLEDVQRICKEIDDGLFISNSKSVDWSKGGKYHHMNWDVKKIFIMLKSIQPATSFQIDHSVPTMDRYRVTAILRELRKQGLLIVS